MIAVKDLIQYSLEEPRAREIISHSIAKKSPVYIINSKSDSFQSLTLGQLQKIQNSHPIKVLIHLEKFHEYPYQGKILNLNHEQIINCFDLWFKKKFYNEFLTENKTCFLDVEPDDPDYARDLDIANIVYRAAINNKNSKLTMKQKVSQLLEAMYPDISEESKKRLIKVTNTNSGKKAGRKKKTE